MPWFKVDDGFHGHPKVRQAGNAAVGLWVRCGTYSAHYLTDGIIPIDVANEYGTARECHALTAAGLWVPTGDTYVIPDFLEYNPSAEQVRSDRKAARLRMQRRRRNVEGGFA